MASVPRGHVSGHVVLHRGCLREEYSESTATVAVLSEYSSLRW